jgi:putative transposase
MPEHMHLLVYPTVLNPSISRYLARIKQPFSKQIKDILVGQGSPLLPQLTVLERPGKTCFRFWQEGPGFDRNHYLSPSGVPGVPMIECGEAVRAAT